jgi:hypothetical protein
LGFGGESVDGEGSGCGGERLSPGYCGGDMTSWLVVVVRRKVMCALFSSCGSVSDGEDRSFGSSLSLRFRRLRSGIVWL